MPHQLGGRLLNPTDLLMMYFEFIFSKLLNINSFFAKKYRHEKYPCITIGGGIYDIWYPNPKIIATKGFSTDLISIGCQYYHIQSLKQSNFRKVVIFKMAAKPLE